VLRVAALQEIVGRLGVEPGALRTALSRLARDGWLERERRGRASFHALTPRGRAELDAASRRIYAEGPPPWEGAWLLAALRPGAPKPEQDAAARSLRAAGFARVSPGLLLRPARPGEGPEAETAPPGVSLFLAPPGASAVAPDLVAAAWPSETPAARFRDLAARLAPLAEAAERAAPEPLDALAARVLLIHLWRRAVLAAPDLPEALRPEGWPGEAARAATRALYWRLAEPAEAWLDACLGGPEGALPPPGPAFRRRFGGPPSAADQDAARKTA
jgi:phenylacetic acid degradation operon negative regulatory protein